MAGPRSAAGAFAGVLFVVVAIGLALFALAIERHERRIRAGSIRTTGSVVALLERHDRRGISYAPLIRFTTSTGDHVDFTASRSGNPSPHKIGDPVPVYYHPDNPRFAGIDDPTSRWRRTAFAGFLSAVSLGIGVYLLRRAREEEHHGR